MKSFETSSVYDFLWSKDELEKKEVKSKLFTVKQQYVVFRVVGRSENQGAISNVVGIICPLPLVGIGLTDPIKYGEGSHGPPSPHSPTVLNYWNDAKNQKCDEKWMFCRAKICIHGTYT